MVDQKIGHKCTGCTACNNICPVTAITMKPDAEGFVYPAVNYEKCVQCGLCIRNCPVLNKENDPAYEMPEVYAGWNLNAEIRINSTSGGVFSAVAEAVIERGGYIAAAVYGERFDICHTIVRDKKELERLRQSKYAQSDLNDVFGRIRTLLEKGELVLFCGTPCQSAGLQRFLRKKYAGLYCCDFICRGVISPKVYRKYLDDKAKDKKGTISKVHFKNKDFGWNRFSTKISFSDGTSYQEDRYHDSYLRGYLNYNLYLRPCCHECNFKQIPRQSDMSLGDFWGIGNYKPELDTDQGTSVVLVNSEKGRELLEWTASKLYMEQRSLDEVLKGNSCLLNSAVPGKYRDYFFANVDKMAFDKLIYKIEQKAMNLTTGQKILGFLHRAKEKVIGNGS